MAGKKNPDGGKTPPRTEPDPPPAPREGDCYCCESCGMSIEVTTDCGCPDGSGVCFKCCNAEMKRDT